MRTKMFYLLFIIFIRKRFGHIDRLFQFKTERYTQYTPTLLNNSISSIILTEQTRKWNFTLIQVYWRIVCFSVLSNGAMRCGCLSSLCFGTFSSMLSHFCSDRYGGYSQRTYSPGVHFTQLNW